MNNNSNSCSPYFSVLLDDLLAEMRHQAAAKDPSALELQQMLEAAIFGAASPPASFTTTSVSPDGTGCGTAPPVATSGSKSSGHPDCGLVPAAVGDDFDMTWRNLSPAASGLPRLESADLALLTPPALCQVQHQQELIGLRTGTAAADVRD
eukprot:gene6350-6583_t